ncbi:MAG: glycosyltransferase, partial [Burkholderiales bacterium]|nr:glycosyltransferase [Burkholderiales bacterium]
QGQRVALTLVGDGPEKDHWMAQAQALGIAAHTRFAGALPLAAVATEMQACHVFCLPSVRESGGAVLLEAMACGRPVVAVAHGGPAEIVDDEVGRALAATHTDDVTQQLADTLADVVRHPAAWAAKGQAGRQRAQAQHDWEQKISAAQAVYASL